MFCGNCGVALYGAHTSAGRCPACGALIAPNGDVIAEAGSATATQNPWQGAEHPLPAQQDSDPTEPDGRLAQPAAILPDRANLHRIPTPHPQRTLIAILASLIAIAGIFLLIFSNLGLGGIRSATAGGSGAQSTGTRGAGNATATVGQSSTGTPASKGSPQPTTSASPRPTTSASPSPTATATPVPPTLLVSPTDLKVNCTITDSGELIVKNAGGGMLNWAAIQTPDVSHDTISPSSGSLTDGQQQTVIISQTGTQSTITVSASGALDSPQTVNVSCL